MTNRDGEWEMDKQSLTDLLKYPESTWLDWKRDFPKGMIKGAKDPKWEEGKGTLLKDMVAIANSEDERNGYLVYGVDGNGNDRTVKGTSEVALDDADLQQWVENAFGPPFTFSFGKVEWSPRQTVAVVSIEHSPSYPHVSRRNIGGVIHEGQVWYRRGSKNTVALHDELRQMFLGSEPIRVTKDDDKRLAAAKAHYKSQGCSTRLFRLSDLQSRLSEGFEVAYFPGSRRKIVLVNYHNEDEQVLMSKPA